jgi:HPt (histidine-containing phosphotransfer) domain-containing protein
MLELTTSTDPPSSSGGAARLDPAALRVLSDLDPDGRAGLLPRILGTFLTSLDRLQAQWADAAARDDWSRVAHAVHTLKSSSASVGAREMSRLCAEIEQAVRQTDPAALDRDAVRARLAALDAQTVEVRQAVRHQLESPR